MLADSNEVNSCNFQEGLFPIRLLAGQDIDIWNPEAHQIRRQAGTTAPERESFANLLKELRGWVCQPVKVATGEAICQCLIRLPLRLDLVDAFRHGNPEARDVYTYWS